MDDDSILEKYKHKVPPSFLDWKKQMDEIKRRFETTALMEAKRKWGEMLPLLEEKHRQQQIALQMDTTNERKTTTETATETTNETATETATETKCQSGNQTGNQAAIKIELTEEEVERFLAAIHWSSDESEGENEADEEEPNKDKKAAGSKAVHRSSGLNQSSRRA